MKKYIVILVLAVGPLVLNAQSSKQDGYTIINTLIENNWTGTGLLMGKEATFTMEWEKVLNDTFIKLEFQNQRKSEKNESIVFNATGFYKIVNDTTVVGTWFDSRGMTFPLKGSLKEHQLTILWGNEDTEMGKTIYNFINNNEISVEDYVMNNGKYLKFGSATYRIKGR